MDGHAEDIAMSDKPETRKGISRLLFALLNSCAGMKTAFRQEPFRQEFILYIILLIPIFLLPIDVCLKLILLVVNTLVLIIEILNTALEIIVDIISPEYNELAGHAKDLGSAAVFLSLVLAAGAWAWITGIWLLG